MARYQNATVTDAKVEIGNYAVSVGAENATAGSAWTNLGAGMVKSFAYVPEMFTSQAGNAPDPIQGVAKETATISLDLIEYDGSAFTAFMGGLVSGTSGSWIVGGVSTVQSAKALKLVNTRTLATGSTQTTTFVFPRIFANSGFSTSPKSDNDADPVNVYSFDVLAKQAATTANAFVFTKTVG
jgi:hypothetical protein